MSYALSYARGNTEGSGTDDNPFQLGADPRLELNQGPLPFDRRHNLVISGRLEVPHTGGLTVSGVTRWMSGAAFTIHDTTTDPDQNGELFDPLPAGTYSGNGSQRHHRRERGRPRRRARAGVQADGHAVRLSTAAGCEPHDRSVR